MAGGGADEVLGGIGGAGFAAGLARRGSYTQRHAGLLRTYASRSRGEIESAINSLERRAAEHLEMAANPAQYAERWSTMSPQEQKGLVKFWEKEAANYAEQAEVLRGLLLEK